MTNNSPLPTEQIDYEIYAEIEVYDSIGVEVAPTSPESAIVEEGIITDGTE